VDENERPLGMIGRNIDRRKPHQRMGRNAHFMTIKVEVNIHEGSLHEAGRAVNLEKYFTLPLCKKVLEKARETGYL
jgi:hypothetical protein